MILVSEDVQETGEFLSDEPWKQLVYFVFLRGA